MRDRTEVSSIANAVIGALASERFTGPRRRRRLFSISFNSGTLSYPRGTGADGSGAKSVGAQEDEIKKVSSWFKT